MPAFFVLVALMHFCVGQSGATDSQAANPAFPDLLPGNYPDKELWSKLGKDLLWDALVNTDLDFIDPKTGRTVAPTFVGATIKTPAICGRIARIWMRFAFHDCGTFDAKTRKGGCNGSLRKEIPATQPFTDPATNQTLDDVFDILGENKARADYKIDPERVENTGFAISTAFFYLWKFEAEKFGLKASWADIMMYGALLGVNICGGPPMLFVPGRVDSETADPPGLLPSPFATLDEVLTAYRRMGLGAMDGVAVQASHTTACFTAGCLDSTPNRFDNAWAKELLAYNSSGTAIPLCVFQFPSAPLKAPQCVAQFDLNFVENQQTRSYLELLAWDTQSFPALLTRTLLSAGLYNFGGYLKGVNLCTPEGCPADQWAFFQIASSSWWRLTSLGLRPNWVGHKYASKEPRPLNALVQGPMLLGEAALPGPPAPQMVNATQVGWQVASKGVEQALGLPSAKPQPQPAVQALDVIPEPQRSYSSNQAKTGRQKMKSKKNKRKQAKP